MCFCHVPFVQRILEESIFGNNAIFSSLRADPLIYQLHLLSRSVLYDSHFDCNWKKKKKSIISTWLPIPKMTQPKLRRSGTLAMNALWISNPFERQIYFGHSLILIPSCWYYSTSSPLFLVLTIRNVVSST